ncbi:MAG TPA: PAS domain-containing sensor histidine kinase [Aromatoleum sp.]|uniref:sensor histidine kinase n=1 Tax=Aromatoleum sp. TaxID=2307007 RepID=UPI002B4AA084|nr:PAS domain-containing sensor histidine kinase [Aromatoleum sp.]HJV25188.1 PAS domain-containing sensor histidine kinase [Aromatoleum sp.]
MNTEPGTEQEGDRSEPPEVDTSWNVQELVFRTLVDMVPDRIYAKDRHSRFVFANKGVAYYMGTTPEAMIGKTDFDFYPPEIASQYFAVEQEMLRSGEPLIAFEQVVPDLSSGATGWLQTTKMPLRDREGHIIGIVGVGRDITELKRIETELLDRNEDLTELNTRLRQTQEQLVQSEKLASLGRVVAGVAHELNTPLGNAMTVVSSLEERHRELEALVQGNQLRRSDLLSVMEATLSGLDLVHRNVTRAADLVRDFRQLAIDPASDLQSRFDLAIVIDEALETIRPRFKRTPFELRTTLEPGIVMDSFPGPLCRVVTNLAVNALVHGFEGRTEGIAHVSCSRLDATHTRLTCSDNGVGMNAEICRHIFEPFSAPSLGQGGAGLGLYAVHGIVTGLLGGTIGFRSSPDQGTTFEVVLPLTAPQP